MGSLSAQGHSTGLSTHVHATHQVPERRHSLSEGLWVPPAEDPQGVLRAEAGVLVSRACSGDVVGSQGAGPDPRTTVEVDVVGVVLAGGLLGPQPPASAEDYGGNRRLKGVRDRQEDMPGRGQGHRGASAGGAEDHGSCSTWHPSLWTLLPVAPVVGARSAPLHPADGQLAPCDPELPLTWDCCTARHRATKQRGSQTRS